MSQLVEQLRRWQSRERLYRLAWGFARWASLIAVGLIVACLVDWWIDRSRETPFWLRVLMTGTQLVGYSVAAYYFLWKLKVPKLDWLASKAEQQIPEFDHRLVTALQLNRTGARTDGMSPQLIQSVTREAETLSAKHNLIRLADSRRIEWALILFVPLFLVLGLFIAFRPTLVGALLRRQALMNAEIPRSVKLINQTRPLQPSGDAVTLKFLAEGAFQEDSRGWVVIVPENQPSEEYDLTFVRRLDENSAVFQAQLPPASVGFTFRARLVDGRTKAPCAVEFAPRPVVNEVEAWLQLPTFVDPAGKRRFERIQPQAEVTALPGCGLRVAIVASKPLSAAKLIFLDRDANGAERPLGDAKPMPLGSDKQSAELETELPRGAVAYRVEVLDENEFANLNPPRRGILMAPDDPPRVNLLSEVFKDPKAEGPLDDYEVNGMPLVLGGQVQIGYTARSPFGLSKAFIMYRVNDTETWTPFPLGQTVADLEKTGKFVPELGVFENSGDVGQVEFYQFPATSDDDPAGLEAGGRYNFQTTTLKKKGKDGKETKLEVGDRVEFSVSVYDRNPDSARPPGKSESRIKTVVTQAQWEDWNRQRDQSRERLKQLEERQRGVFKPNN